MKLIVFVVSVLAGTCFNAAAQEKGFQIRPGFYTGVAFSDIDSDPEQLTSKEAGNVSGIFVEIPFWHKVSIQPEVQFAQKGATFDFRDGNTTIELSYLQFPLFVKFRSQPSTFAPYFIVGPGFGVLLTARTKTTDEDSGETDSRSIKEEVKPFDFSLELGGGSEYRLSENVFLMIDIRFSLGLSDIDKTADNEWKTSDVKLLIGGRFTL